MMFFTAGLLILANARAMEGAQNKSGTKAPQPEGFLHTELNELSAKARQSGQSSMSSYRGKLQKSKWAGYAIKATRVVLPLRLVCIMLSGTLSGLSLTRGLKGDVVKYPKLFEWANFFGVFHIAAHNFSHLLITPSFAFAAWNGPTPMKVLGATSVTLSLAQLTSGIFGYPKFKAFLENCFSTGPSDPKLFFESMSDYFQWKTFDDQVVKLIDMGVHAAFWILHFI
jgi:hypothetical protein